jgi:hypothetical protein
VTIAPIRPFDDVLIRVLLIEDCEEDYRALRSAAAARHVSLCGMGERQGAMAARRGRLTSA